MSSLKEIIQPPPVTPPPDKTLHRLWNKNVLREIYRPLLSKHFRNAILGPQDMVQ